MVVRPPYRSSREQKGPLTPNVRRHLLPFNLFVLLVTGLLIAAPYGGVLNGRVLDYVNDLGPVALGILTVTFAWRVGGRPDVDPTLRQAWRRLAVAFGCWCAGDVLWFVYETLLQRHPFPS